MITVLGLDLTLKMTVADNLARIVQQTMIALALISVAPMTTNAGQNVQGKALIAAARL